MLLVVNTRLLLNLILIIYFLQLIANGFSFDNQKNIKKYLMILNRTNEYSCFYSIYAILVIVVVFSRKQNSF